MAHVTIKEPDKKLLREFGFVMAGAVVVVFGLLLPYLFDRPWPVWPWVVAVVFVSVGLVFPMGLKHVYVWWMRFGLLLGRITTPLILGIVFYLLITPVGLVARIFRDDPMRRSGKPGQDSYRLDSRQPDNEHMERPF